VIHPGEPITKVDQSTPGSEQVTPVNVRAATRMNLFAILLAASLVVGWHALLGTFKLAAHDQQYTQILLILPVSLTLIYAGWQSVRNFSGRSLSGILSNYGLPILGLSVITAVASVVEAAQIGPDVRLSLEMLALITWWIGSFVFCFGNRAGQVLLFPLCFLYWMVPLPGAVLNEVIKILQQGTAFFADLLFTAVGVPTIRDGLLLYIPGLTVEVAKECSSIRSSSMLLVTTMVLAQLYLKSPIKKGLVIALAVPLSVAKNGLRIFTIAMLGTRVDPGFLYGRLHHQGGVVFFLISLAIVFLLLCVLGRSENDGPAKAPVGAIS
jgi:exosortase